MKVMYNSKIYQIISINGIYYRTALFQSAKVPIRPVDMNCNKI